MESENGEGAGGGEVENGQGGEGGEGLWRLERAKKAVERIRERERDFDEKGRREALGLGLGRIRAVNGLGSVFLGCDKIRTEKLDKKL